MKVSNDRGILPRRAVQKRLGLALVIGLVLGAFPLAFSAPQAHAASCTDGGRTYKGLNMVGKYVELRGSANCGGTAWIRWNYVKTSEDAAGTIKFQVMDYCGNVSNGESNSISTAGGAQSHVTAYRYGIAKTRMIYTERLGSPASFTTPWYNLVSKTTQC